MFGGFLLFKQSEYAIIVLGSIWTPTYSRRDFFLLTVRGLKIISRSRRRKQNQRFGVILFTKVSINAT